VARRGPLLGALALSVAVAVLLVWRQGGGDRSEAVRPALAPSALNARELGFHLLTLPDRDEVLAGMSTLTKAAEQGDVEARIALGRIYLRGVPAVPQDVTLARGWFMRAEPSRHPSAAYYLGVMSQNGQGVKADPGEAARWFEIAAQGGSPDAMFLLANAYRAGAGVPKDDAKAVALYERAGEMEHAASLQALAMAYGYGELGLEPDEDERRRYMLEAEHATKHRPAPP
jgi:uncharacterized protein